MSTIVRLLLALSTLLLTVSCDDSNKENGGQSINTSPTTPQVEGGVLLHYPSAALPAHGEVVLDPTITVIGERAFEGLKGLKKLTAPAVIKVGARALANCTALTTIELPATIEIGDNAFIGVTQLKRLTLPKTEVIGQRAFVGATLLEEIHLPTLKELKNNAFAGCKALKRVHLGDTPPMIGSDHPFTDTSEQKELLLPQGYDVDRAEEWALVHGFAFINGEKIVERVAPPAGFKAEGRKIVSITDPALAIQYKVEFPDYFKELGDGLFANVKGADFGNITANGVERVGDKCFHSAYNIWRINLPNLKYIGKQAFYLITQLSKLTNCQAVEEVGDQAFAMCKFLEEVHWPNLKVMGNGVFDNCSYMSSRGVLRLGATPPEIKGNLGTINDEPIKIATLKIPKGSRAAYDQWEHRHLFKNIIEE